MSKYIESKDGYIVFEDKGLSPQKYHMFEKWFQTYDEAIDYALSIVHKNVQEFKNHIDSNSVVVYEGGKEFLHQHRIPSGHRVVFKWTNYLKNVFEEPILKIKAVSYLTLKEAKKAAIDKARTYGHYCLTISKQKEIGWLTERNATQRTVFWVNRNGSLKLYNSDFARNYQRQYLPNIRMRG